MMEQESNRRQKPIKPFFFIIPNLLVYGISGVDIVIAMQWYLVKWQVVHRTEDRHLFFSTTQRGLIRAYRGNGSKN